MPDFAELLVSVDDARVAGDWETLVALLQRSDEWHRYALRAAVARALGDIAAPESAPALAALLEDDRVETRRAVARALGRISHPVSVEALERALEDPDSVTRQWAANGLGKVGGPRASHALSTFTNTTDKRMRDAVLEALARIGDDTSNAALELLEKNAGWLERRRIGQARRRAQRAPR